MDDPEILHEVVYNVSDYERLLSFDDSFDASLFEEWWNEDGCGQFMEWAEQQRDETE